LINWKLSSSSSSSFLMTTKIYLKKFLAFLLSAKTLASAALFFSLLSCGLATAAYGPALPQLQIQTNSFVNIYIYIYKFLIFLEKFCGHTVHCQKSLLFFLLVQLVI
jgi:hypothetical protein